MKIDILDHGYIEHIESWGSDERIIEAARMSTNKGFLGWGPKEDGSPGDEKLLRYLYTNKHCYDAETEVLTQRGFVRWPDVRDNDILGQWDQVVDSLVYEAPLGLFRRWHSGRMYRVDHGGVDLLVTENHRMLVKRIVSVPGENRQEWSQKWMLVAAEELRDRSMIRYRKHAARRSRTSIDLTSGETVSFPKHSDPKALLRLIGFFIGDGHADGSRQNGITFHLRKNRKIKFLHEVCLELGWELAEISNDQFVVRAEGITRLFREQFYDLHSAKQVPAYLLDLSESDASALLDGLRASDGSLKRGAWQYSTTSKQVADAVQLLVLHAGGAAHIRYDGYLYRVMVLSRMVEPVINQGKLNTSWEEFEGEVFCASTRTGVLVVRRNGKIVLSGNSTPFEMAGLTFDVQAPILVFRQWHRHRTQCLAGDTMIHFESPKSLLYGRRYVYKMPISEVCKKWQPTVRRERPERQENALWNRSRVARMLLRQADEETKDVIHTHIVDVIRSEPKQLYRVCTLGGRSIRTSKDHRYFTNYGWLTLGEAIHKGAGLAVERTDRGFAQAWGFPLIDETEEVWRYIPGWAGLYEVSDMGRVRRLGKEPKRGTVMSNGYTRVNLNRPGTQLLKTVHSLVLEAFVGSPQPGQEARHENHNRMDARLSNLSWGSSGDNSTDMVKSDRQQRLTIGFEEISACQKAGVEPTYDLSVEGPYHNFVADGFVVHNSYNEMSARYTPLPDMNYIPSVERLMLNSKTNKQAGVIASAEVLTTDRAEWFRDKLKTSYGQIEALYQAALGFGVPKELARVPLPVARYSRMRASANLRNWIGFLTLRMDPHAEWEIREYANAVSDVIAKEFPRTWELFNEQRLSS